MIRLIAEGLVAINASRRMLSFRPDWRQGFNMTLPGLWRSFFAAVMVLPLIALIILGRSHAGFETDFGRFIPGYVLSWLIFPLAAALACRVTGARSGFVPWVIVHNWAVVWLYGLQALLWMLFTAQLINREILSLAFQLYMYLRILVHWRIAYATLGLPTITSALAAAVPVLAGEILVLALYMLGTADPASAG